MVKTLLSLGSVAVVAAGFIYVARTHPLSSFPSIQASSFGGTSGPPLRLVCVQPVRNFSKRPLDTAGLDTALVYQLKRAKVPAEIAPVDGGAEGECSAFVDTKITEVSLQGRSRAELEFSVVMKNEIPPRLSSVAKGRSGTKPPVILSEEIIPSSQPFEASPIAQPTTGPLRDAIVAAFVDQASQIAVAHRWGFPSQTSSAK